MGRALNAARLRLERPLAVAAATAVLALAVVPPVLQIAHDLAGSANALQWLASDRLWWLFLRSVVLAVLVTALSCLVGVPLGVLFARADYPLRKALFATHLATVFLPPFIPALGWFHVFGQRGFAGGAVSARVLFSDVGFILVLTACFAPIATALTALGVRGVDAALEDAARIASTPARTAWRVLVPLAAPTILLAGIIVFALTLSELGVPMFLRVDVYPAAIFARLGGLDFAPGEAAVFVLPLVLLALALLAVERRFAGRHAVAALGSTRGKRAPLFSSRSLPFFAALAGAVVSATPLVTLGAHAAGSAGSLELSNWAGDAPWNSLLTSVLAAAVMSCLAAVLGREFARGSRVGSWLDGFATLAFILPSSILGVGLIEIWNRPSTQWLYASAAILVLGFVARYSILAIRTFAAVLAQIHVSLEEAAQTVGATYLQRLALLVRLDSRGLAAAFILGLVFALRDLETAALFYPPGREPLTVRIFTLEANGPPAVVSALCVLQVALTFAAMGAAWSLLRGRRSA